MPASSSTTYTPIGAPPEQLRTGDRMTRSEFHALYLQTPKHFKAELIDGEVFVASPMKIDHSINQGPLAGALTHYENQTLGVQSGENATIVLDDKNEPQPDLFIRILPEYGGQSRTTDDGYIEGPPELVIEVSDTSRSIDLNRKRTLYQTQGVLEYLVIDLRDRRLHWFDLTEDDEYPGPNDGIYRIQAFPGLWLDSAALFDRNMARLIAAIDLGLATPEHAAFIAKLASQKKA